MDELDLVRLARPGAPEPDEARLAAIKTSALGSVDAARTATADAVADDGQPADIAPLIELATGPTPRRRNGPLILSIAAALVLLVAGTIALGVHRRSGSGVTAADVTTVQAATVSTAPLATVSTDALTGEWQVEIRNTESTSQREVVAFKAAGSGVALTTTCGTSVSSSYRLDGDVLVLGDPLSSIELGCQGLQSLLSRHQQLVQLLEARPTVRVDGDVMTLSVGGVEVVRLGPVAALDVPAPSGQPTTAPPTSAPPTTAPPPTPNLADGNVYDITRLVVDGAERPLLEGSSPSISFTNGRVNIATGCNGLSGRARILDGRLTLDEFARTVMACNPERMTQENALAAIATANPTVDLRGDVLVLTANTSLVEAHARTDRQLVGTKWNRGARILPDNRGLFGVVGVAATLTLADGTWSYVGCIQEGGRYTLDGATLTLSRDATTSATIANPACTDDKVNDDLAVAADIFDRPVTWSLKGNDLTLVKVNGGGAQFHAG